MNILKNTAIISFFTIASQALGVLRDKLLVTYVGVGPIMDIYNASFKIPDLINACFVSFVGLTVVVPFLTTSYINNNKEEMEKKFSTLFFFFSLSISFISFVIIITLDLYLDKIFPTFSAENLKLLSDLTKIMLLQPLLLGLSNLFVSVAQTHKNFIYYSIAPVFYNLGIVFGVVFFYKHYGIYGLIYGVLLGAIMHIFINSIFIWQRNIKVKVSYFNFEYIKTILPISAWRSIAFIMVSLKQFILTIFAGFVGIGMISAYTFSLNLVNMAVAFFATSYSVASFPILSELYEKKEFVKLKNTINKNEKEIFWFSILFASTLYFFSSFIVKIIYNGEEKVFELFKIMILAIPFLNLEQYYARAMMAIGKVRILSLIHVLAFLILFLFLFIFYKVNHSYLFLARAFVITMVTEIAILVHFTRSSKIT